MKNLFILLFLVGCLSAQSQVAINTDGSTPDNSAMLDIKSNSKGLLVPRLTLTNRNAIVSPATGLLIYQTDNTPGYYYNSGTSGSPAWVLLGSGLTLPYSGSVANGWYAFSVTNSLYTAIFGASTVTSSITYGVSGSSASGYGAGVYGYGSSTTGQNSGVKGVSASTSGTGIYGEATALTGNTIGVYGYSYSATGNGVYGAGTTGVFGATVTSTGVGVFGVNNAETGNSIGVVGASSGVTGRGVLGQAYSYTGTNYGVYGLSYSSAGYGVYGNGGTGVYGTTSSPTSSGVFGYNTASTGNAYGVYGKSGSLTGFGMYAEGGTGLKAVSTANGAAAVLGDALSVSSGTGVYGLSNSGMGVRGNASAPTGPAVGVYGSAASTDGYGVYGTGATGVFGTTSSTSGYGVRGYNDATTGDAYGIIGRTMSTSGSGVYALASATSGVTYGLRGMSFSAGQGAGVYGSGYDGITGYSNGASGAGVRGQNGAGSGNTYGVWGSVGSSAGWAGYFLGRLYASGYAGFGTNNPGAGIHLVGNGYPSSFMILEATGKADAGFRLYESGVAKWHIFNNAGNIGLQIYNSVGTTAIFCKQDNSYVGIGMTSPAYQLHVGGEAAKTTGTTAWVISSDIRLKNVVGNYTKGLNEIAALKPIRFTYRANNPRQLPSEKEQVGFVAQEVQKVFPEAVTQAADGYLDFNIHAINVAMVNAIKELKAENDKLKAENEQIKMRDDKIMARLEKLEALMFQRAEK